MKETQLIKAAVGTIRRYAMISDGDHVIVAVSGGADSTALLSLLHNLSDRWGLTLTVAHLEHGIRGEASRREASFVEQYAEKLGLQCVVEHRDVPGFKEAEGESLQQAARKARYRFYREVLERCGADKVALGHNAEDQAETVLMRLIRGSSVRGLQGIPPVRGGIYIRPLIAVSRSGIESYLAENDIPWIPDTSAQEPQYLRNRIRHHLLSLLRREYNPQIREVLCRTAEHMQACNEVIDRDIDAAVDGICTQAGGEIRCPVSTLAGYSRSYRALVIRAIVGRLRGHTRGIEHVHIESLCDLADKAGPAKTVQMPGGGEAIRQYGEIVFTAFHKESRPFCYTFDHIPERVVVPECRVALCFTFTHKRGIPDEGRWCEYLNAEAVVYPLVIRSWRPGDRFHPLGMKGTKKVKDFFSDEKVPSRLRRSIPLVVFNDRIAWVCGHRIDERFKVGCGTNRVLRVSCENL